MKKVMLCCCALFLALSVGWPAPRGVPASEGIQNYGRVSERLHRGAQPDEKGMQNLRRLGVRTIVNLRMPGDAWKSEEALARAYGMVYTNVPMKGLGRPTEEQVNRILAIIRASPGPVFVHCQYGCDRTGIIIACYRIQHDGWSSKDALSEAVTYGLSKAEVGMKSFVTDFGLAAKRRSGGG